MGNWSDLCNDILEMIMDNFLGIEDIVRFGAVCRQWRSFSVEKWQLSTVYPWLMLAEKEDSDRRGFYSLSTQKVYHMNLPEARGRACWSSHGWLITFGLDLQIHLLNPFSRVQIRLPPQPTLPHQYEFEMAPENLRQVFITKVVLSSRPDTLSVETTQEDDDEKCVVMAISSQISKLAFLRLGDEVWTAIDCPVGFCDIIYFNGQFYAINNRGRLFICDISNPQPKAIEFANEPEEGVEEYYDFFLVESLGELFMVAQKIDCCDDYPFSDLDDYPDDASDDDDDPVITVGDDDDYTEPKKTGVFRYETEGFDVYKFNFDNREWMQVMSLENRAMFVGNNSSFTVFPSEEHPGCEPNCIYFTDSYEDNLPDGAGHDMGVFRMETQEIESHYTGPEFFSHFCTPLWICPSFF